MMQGSQVTYSVLRRISSNRWQLLLAPAEPPTCSEASGAASPAGAATMAAAAARAACVDWSTAWSGGAG
jgi:nicotinamide mononucleotide (NMN) deamidase PncC